MQAANIGNGFSKSGSSPPPKNRVVYRLFHNLSSNGRVGYIGKDSYHPERLNLKQRAKDKNCPKLYLALKKYPVLEHWQKEVLASGFLTDEALSAAEVFFIKKFDSKNNGYNCTDGGEGVSGLVRSEASKAQVSKNKRGPSALCREEYKDRAILWYSKGRSSYWIGKKVGVDRVTILRELHGWGVAIRDGSKAARAVGGIEKHKERIIRWYSKGRSSTWIGKKFNVTDDPILRWLRIWGVPKATETRKEKHKENVIHWYSKGKSANWIEKRIITTPATILKWLREWGIPIRPRKGRKLSVEHRAKVSKALAGRRVSEETREKIGKANKGKKRSDATRAKMSESASARKILVFAR